jgi:predicted  nucleic acid-binding Zn-ribbon protein
VSIGRATDCTIRSNRKSVSRHHAEFRYTNGAFEVIDLNSSNGTWLIENEQRFEIAHERLEDQDEIWCGDFIVHFLVDDDAEKELTVNDQHPSGQNQSSQNQSGQNQSGEQGYVSGPTEAADAFEFDGGNFGAEPSEAHQEDGGGLDQHSSVAFDYDEVEELGADDMVELDKQPAGGGHSGQAYSGDEVERLLQEKQSIEDLASRQAFEIEELQAKLEQASQQLDQNGGAASQQAHAQLQQQLDQALADVEALRHENQQLREQLDSGQQNAAKVESLAAELESERHQVEALRSELQSSGDELAGARQRIEKAQEQESALQRDLADKSDRVEALEHDVRTLEEELAASGGSGDDVERVREQLEKVRQDYEKSDRLLNEYERRNAELRTELDEQRDSNEELRQAAEQNEEKLAELFDARDALQTQLAELEPAKEELDEKREALEQAEELNADLKAEVQGLKQRLQLERRRSDEDVTEELERLEAELIEATERISELEQQREELSGELAEAVEEKEAADGGFDPEELAEIRQRLSALERLADAIDRTDLEPLSTVDRIRLQSAIRETNPKKTLQEALDLLT